MPRFPLKSYQQESLKLLGDYSTTYRQAVERGDRRPDRDAFEEVTNRDYYAPPGFEGVPYICIRVPTGGGKTLLGAHAVGVVGRRLLHVDQPCCLWVTPTVTIRDQTLKGLRDHRHPYRLALEEELQSDVEVMTLEDALLNSRMSSAPAVIVTTIHSYRIKGEDGSEIEANRRIYRDSGYKFERFERLNPAEAAMLAKDEGGLVYYSLANALMLRRPIVIMDEAHNARTPTSFESLARFGPSLVLELTATPQREHDPAREKYASNVLHAVSALELKHAGMIKLPIELESRGDWMEVLAATKQRLDALDERADEWQREKGGPHIRPIALVQAEPHSRTRETHDVQQVKSALIDVLKVDPAEVRICTGDLDELGGEDLMAADCRVRFIITVNKLREGWDCPFAYVLGSVGNVATATAVEQILGRVLRMPYARPTEEQALDRAYAFILSPDVIATATQLRDRLVEECGFDEHSAADALRVSAKQSLPGLGFNRIPMGTAPKAEALPASVRAKTTYDPETKTLEVHSPLTRDETAALRAAVDSEEDRKQVDDFWMRERPAGVAAKPLHEYASPLAVPRLAVREGLRSWLFEPEELDTFSWDLDSCTAELAEGDFSLDVRVGTGAAIDVGERGGTITERTGEIRLRQLEIVAEGFDWSAVELVAWLDRELHRDSALAGLAAPESQAWLRRVVGHLVDERHANLPVLVRRRVDLADVLRKRIAAHGRTQVKKAAELLLGRDRDAIATEFGEGLTFYLQEEEYAPSNVDDRGHKFKKHAFTTIAAMNDSEFECAARIDGHENVKRWVRNPEYRSQGGFSLPKAPGNFFPDFIVECQDGTIVAMEYKNKKLAEAPSELIKKDIGELWADRSGGRVRFAWVVGRDWAAMERALQPPS